MTRLLLALAAGYGAFLLYTRWAFEWRGMGLGPSVSGGSGGRRGRGRDFLVQAGLEDVRLVELAAVVAVLGVVGAGLGYAVFGGVIGPAGIGLAAGAVPIVSAKQRSHRRRARAREAWPRMIEEIRLQATSLGRSIPQALLAVGLRGPEQMRPAFEAAQREWLISTDFARTVATLKGRLADATADVVCETLLVAHEIGGSDIERRLSALIEDRVADTHGRKDAVSKQAGARFARRFVLAVPLGMALAGLRIGDGRDAYQTALGQGGVTVALLLTGLCWLWASRIMRLDDEERVFHEDL
ncbi:MAG: type II secretion system F family protein [Egibacteraceae bacterium]